jgi:hypothetical protein
MVDKEYTCLFRWAQSLDMHTKQLIKLEFYGQHKALCYEYKDAKYLKEANTWYVVIH